MEATTMDGAKDPSSDPTLSTPDGASGFKRRVFLGLGAAGAMTGGLCAVSGYYLFAGTVPPSEDLALRLVLALRWMTLPVLSLVLGILAASMARLPSENANGSSPPPGSALEMHRRYLQNTLEQFAYFFIAQMALVTWLPADALHLVPVLCVQFLAARLIFWAGYFRDPAYRAFGLTMNHVNIFVLGYVIYRVVLS